MVIVGVTCLGVWYYPEWHYRTTQEAVYGLNDSTEPERMLTVLAKAHEAFPENTQFEEKYFEQIIKSDAKTALQKLEAKASQAELSEPLQRFLTKAYLQESQLSEADKAVAVLLSMNPNDADHLKLEGRIAFEQAQYARALKAFDAARIAKPDDVEVRFYRARSQALIGMIEDRIRAKAELLELGEGDSEFKMESLKILATSERLPILETDRQYVMALLAAQPKAQEWFLEQPYEVASSVAHQMAKYDTATAFAFAEQLLKREQVALREQLLFIEVAQKRNLPDKAAALIEKLLSQQPDHVTLLMAQAYNAFLKQERPEAIRLVDGILSKHSEEQQALGLLIKMFRAAAESADQDSMVALGQRIIQHPSASNELRLFVYEKCLQQIPERRDEWLEQAIAQSIKSHLLELSYWLNQLGAYEKTINVISPSHLSHSSGLCLNYLEALLQLERLEEFDGALTNGQCDLPELQVSLFQCRRFIQVDDEKQADLFWKKAFQLAQESANENVLKQVARVSGYFKNDERTADAFRVARLYGADFALTDWNQFFKSLVATGEYAEAFDAAALALKMFPESAAFENNWLYLSLLLNEEVEERIIRLERIVEVHPDKAPYQTTLAFAYHLAGEPSKALKIIEDANRLHFNPSEAANTIYANILAGNGKFVLARSIAREVDQDKLIEPEKQLIAELLRPLSEQSHLRN